MFSRFLILIAVWGAVACHRVSNVISTVRLDCGADVSWQDDYLKFVDGMGRPLAKADLEYVSLEGFPESSMRLSSKGCLALSTPGTWLVRHRERPEGLIVGLEEFKQSSILQLQDITSENLKPVCPPYEMGAILDLHSVFPETENHDLRGYEIGYTLAVGDKEWYWPLHSFKQLQNLSLATFFPEGEVTLKLTTVNLYRRGEASPLTCPLRFDATGPVVKANLSQAVAKTFRGRPFLSISSDQDLRFTSDAADFTAVDVCYSSRKDWNAGRPEDLRPICEKPERIAFDRPVPFGERRGFWQVQYRGVDRAGNASSWSEPVVLLLEQIGLRKDILNLAITQTAEVKDRVYAGTTQGMLMGLKAYRIWQDLPTVYEQEELQNSILLVLHRPWLVPGVQQIMRVIPETDLPRKSFPVMGGKKFVSIELQADARGNFHFVALLQDVETYEVKPLPTPNVLPDGWGVSQDGTRFFYFSVSGGSRLYYGKIQGDEVLTQELQNLNFITAARFVKNDTELAVVTEKGIEPGEGQRITSFAAGDQLMEIGSVQYLVDIHTMNKIPSYTRLTDDARSLWTYDYEKKQLYAYSLFEDGVQSPAEVDAEIVPGFPIYPNYVRSLDSDHHFFLQIPWLNLNYCSFIDFDSQRPDGYKKRWAVEGLPCDSAQEGTPLDDGVWMRGNDNFATVVYKPGSAAFQTSILKPELAEWAIEQSSARLITPSGDLMFSGSEQYKGDDTAGILRAWKRNSDGKYDLFTDFWPCEWAAPSYINFDSSTQTLAHACYTNGSEVKLWNMTTQPPTPSDVLDVGAYISSMVLAEDKLLIATSEGRVLAYQWNGAAKPTFIRNLALDDQIVEHLLYDPKDRRLYTLAVNGPAPIKIWDIDDLTRPLKALAGLPSFMSQLALSDNRQYLAVAGYESPRFLVWDLKKTGQPSLLSDHVNQIVDMAFIGGDALLVTGSSDGELRLRDLKNPDFPSVSFFPGLAGRIRNIAAVPGLNEFVVEVDRSRMFHYKLDSLNEILHRTCSTLQAYLHYQASSFPEQAALCSKLGKQ